MTTRRGLFGLFAGAACVAAKPEVLINMLEVNATGPKIPLGTLRAMYTNYDRLIHFRKEITREYLCSNLFSPYTGEGIEKIIRRDSDV